MKKLILNFLAIVFVASMSSCIKDKFDAPPYGGTDPNMRANFTIDSVKARYTGANYQFTENLVISAVVVGDDRNGNLYKQLAIEDSTGGIALLTGGSYLYNNYPVGRRLFIKLKGLWITQYKGLYQIAGSIAEDGSINGIPSSLYSTYIFPGKWGLPVIPHVVTINQLNASYQSMLIELDNVEFAAADANKPYADGYNQLSLSRTIKDCSGHSTIAYTSGFTNFAKVNTPTGNGKLLAVFSVYGTTPQLIIRDTADVQFYGENCGGGHVTGTGIKAIRNAYTGSDVTLPTGTTVSGIVISDYTNANTDPKNLIVQDTSAGIVVRFSGNHSFAVGTKVTINVAGTTLTSFAGLLEVNNVPLANATANGTGTITPRVTTIDQINANEADWESTLVQTPATTISSSASTYGGNAGNATLTDATGSVALYTRTAATFAGTNFPTTQSTITSIVGIHYSTVQVSIRSTSDVQ